MEPAIAIALALIGLMAVARWWESRASRERTEMELFKKAMAMRPEPPPAQHAPLANTPARRLALVLAAAALALWIAAAIGMEPWSHAESVFWFDSNNRGWYRTAGRAGSVLALVALALWFLGPAFRKLVAWIARGRVD